MWLPGGPDPSSGRCTEPWHAVQWGIRLDGTVQTARGAPEAKALAVEASTTATGRRLVITLPENVRRVGIVYSDSDDGRTQERLLGTSTLKAGDAHTLFAPPTP